MLQQGRSRCKSLSPFAICVNPSTTDQVIGSLSSLVIHHIGVHAQFLWNTESCWGDGLNIAQGFNCVAVGLRFPSRRLVQRAITCLTFLFGEVLFHRRSMLIGQHGEIFLVLIVPMAQFGRLLWIIRRKISGYWISWHHTRFYSLHVK